MKLKDMKFIKLNRDKTPKEKLDKSYSYSTVQYYADLGVLIQEPFVVFDVDDHDEFLKLKEIILDKKVKCNIMKSTRGGHFWFKSSKPLSNNIKIKTPIGISVDVRSYGKLCYTKVKQEQEWREWLTDFDFEELDEVPFWLQPINHSFELVGLKQGDGRNDKLFSYIITLVNYMTKEKVRETFYIINDYILGDKLDYKELETILRDESFDNVRPNFFDKNKFLFDKYAKCLCNNYNILRRDKLLYVYNENHYTSDSSIIERLALKHIPNLNRNQRNEVLDYLRLVAPEIPEISYYYIICKNCIVDVRDRKQYDYSKDFFIPTLINATYDPKIKKCEVVDKFMSRVCCGDKEVESLIYEMIGYCLIPTSKFQKSFILFGDGSNGKSTLLDAIISLLGDYNVSSLSFKEINHNFKLAEITDKLANIGDDISDEYITDSSIFKKLVTGEEITVEKKHEQPYKIRNTATIIFATNNLPNMQDKSNGMVRRLCIIPFNAVISKDQPDFDPFIIDKLTTDEAKSYILNKALLGLERVFVNQGFTIPKIVDEVMEDYYREVNNVIRYLDYIDDEKLIGKISKDAYNDYVFWCANQNESAYKLRRFNTEIRKRTSLKLVQKKKNGDVLQVWVKE